MCRERTLNPKIIFRFHNPASKVLLPDPVHNDARGQWIPRIDNFPLGDALEMVFTGSGECANIDWQFLGLSMPTWVLIGVIGLGGAGIWNNLRKQH